MLMQWISRTDNASLMAQAREGLKEKWNLAVVAAFVLMVIHGTLSAFSNETHFSGILALVVSGPLSLGFAHFALAIARGQTPDLRVIFSGFGRFATALVAHLLLTCFVILWSLLLVVPGIVAALSYAMTFFILAEDEQIEPLAALEQSKAMMYGNRWKLFCLSSRFLGWFLLSVLTAGIGFLWLIPYVQVTMARFYEDLKAHDAGPGPEPDLAKPDMAQAAPAPELAHRL